MLFTPSEMTTPPNTVSEAGAQREREALEFTEKKKAGLLEESGLFNCMNLAGTRSMTREPNSIISFVLELQVQCLPQALTLFLQLLEQYLLLQVLPPVQ